MNAVNRNHMIILCIILIIIVAIILHEFGHYMTSRHYGVIAQEFNIGFGLKLFGFEKGGTKWNVRLLPIGGSCVYGENDADLDKLTALQRIKVLAAGPLVNLGLALFSLILAALLKESNAISFVSSALSQAVAMIPSMFSAFIEAMSPDYPTLATTGEEFMAVTQGMTIRSFVVYVLTISYLMNMMLFIFNILPIPALDGGQIALTIPELLGRPLKEKTINRLNYVFFILIMGWSAAYLIKDTIIELFFA